MTWKVMQGSRPSRPALDSPAFRDWGLTEEMWKMMLTCWEREPGVRPTAKDVNKNLPGIKHVVDHRSSGDWGVLSPSSFRDAMTDSIVDRLSTGDIEDAMILVSVLSYPHAPVTHNPFNS